jgi:hypothetical protein
MMQQIGETINQYAPLNRKLSGAIYAGLISIMIISN